MRRKYWIAQLGGWMSYFILLMLTTLVLGKIQLSGLVITQLTITAIVGLFSTHSLHVFYLKFGFVKQLSFRLIKTVFFSSFVAGLFMTMVIEILENIFLGGKQSFNWKSFTFQYLGNVVLIMIWNLIYFLYHIVREIYNERIRNISLEVERQKAELNQLKSQLNPHFLFNALNGIRALISLNPAEAKLAVTNLSELLRSSLNSGKLDKIDLRDELKMVENYLHIEKMRFEDRLEVEWRTSIGHSDLTVPPFTLLLLVENAIKHGISKVPDGGNVLIQLEEKENKLEIIVSNPGNISTARKAGIGLQNLTSRLSYFYKEKAFFKLTEKNDRVVAELSIPIVNT